MNVFWRYRDLNFNTVLNGILSLFVISSVEDYFIYIY